MKLTKGALGQPERLQHCQVIFQKTVTLNDFYALIIPDAKTCCAVWSKGCFEAILELLRTLTVLPAHRQI
jgi:hypothetical protein